MRLYGTGGCMGSDRRFEIEISLRYNYFSGAVGRISHRRTMHYWHHRRKLGWPKKRPTAIGIGRVWDRSPGLLNSIYVSQAPIPSADLLNSFHSIPPDYSPNKQSKKRKIPITNSTITRDNKRGTAPESCISNP